MTPPMLFILAALAVYRLAWLLTTDEGPFGMLASVRARIDPLQKTWLGRGVNCPLCVGFWLALLFAPLGGAWWPLWWPALAGAAMVLGRIGR